MEGRGGAGPRPRSYGLPVNNAGDHTQPSQLSQEEHRPALPNLPNFWCVLGEATVVGAPVTGEDPLKRSITTPSSNEKQSGVCMAGGVGGGGAGGGGGGRGRAYRCEFCSGGPLGQSTDGLQPPVGPECPSVCMPVPRGVPSWSFAQAVGPPARAHAFRGIYSAPQPSWG